MQINTQEIQRNANKCVNIRPPIPEVLIIWAASVGVQLVSNNQLAEYELSFSNNRLELHWLGEEKFSPIYVQVPNSSRVSASNLLIRAMGKRSKFIADLTAGLGVDALTLAAFGKQVICIERSAPVAMLLYEGLSRCPENISNRVQLEFCDAYFWLKKNSTHADTFYIDTMFSDQKKSAKSPKSMQIIRHLVGDDFDAPHLFDKAGTIKGKRIVVKKDNKAAKVDNGQSKNNHHVLQLKGKTVRFDIYYPKESLD